MPNFIPVDFDPFAEVKEIEKIIYTNEPQREIWLACAIGAKEANLAYNESVSLEISGELNFGYLKKAVEDLVLRHEALRSTISPNGETLIVYRNYPVEFEQQDLSALDETAQKSSIEAFLKNTLSTEMPLSDGPLFKVFLHKLSATKHFFTIIKHHAIGDGWSTGVMLEDLSKIYNAYSKGESIFLGKAAQMSDYFTEQSNFKLTEEYKKTENFWLNLYKDEVPVLDLPTDFPRQSPRTYNASRIDYPLNKDFVQKLKTVGAKNGCSLVTTLLVAFEFFLFHKTRQKNIVVGLPASGQAATGLIDLVGHCVNLLPLKSTVTVKDSFTNYLKKRKSEILDAYDHQRLTFGELIQKLYIQRDRSRVTLVPVIFNVDMGMDNSVAFDGLDFKLISNPRAYENFEIFLNATGSKDGLLLEWAYNTDLFKKETILQFIEEYKNILDRIITDTNFTLDDLRGVENPPINIPKAVIKTEVNETLTGLFYNSAKNHATNTALTFGSSTLTYQDLNKKTNQLARLLIHKKVQVNDRIAIPTDRSIETIISLLAIIKVGACYVPLDNSYPKDRINFVLKNSDAKFLIASKNNTERYSDAKDKLLFIEEALVESEKLSGEDLSVKTEKDTLVYILHTSGSTGNPKGVCMGQNALVNLLLWQKEKSIAGQTSKTLQFSPLSFDVSFQEIFATFITGGNLVLITEDLRMDPFKLLDLISEKKINRIFLPFVALQSITESAVSTNVFPKDLKEVMTAGEQLKITPQIVKFFSSIPDSVLYNQYGPTEAHVVTELKLEGKPEQWPNLPSIGKAIYNTEMFILDEQLNEIANGEIGELCISGLCLANGYLNLPEMTSEKFTYIPSSNIRIYKTGDLARYLPDGNIEFLGRRDHQVKIRGYRIELGEIEAHLNQQPNVKQAVVTAQEEKNGNKKLIAYVTVDDKESDKNARLSWQERWNSIHDLGVHADYSSEKNLSKSILNQLPNADSYIVQADEWVIETTKRIKEIGAKNIVEIGCGAGQFISKLAPDVENYLATDYSDVAISFINDKIQSGTENWQNVKAFATEANDFSHINGISPDLILINSVIQYFADTDYLFDVIEKASKTISEGCIFIGDVQGKSTIRMHHASEQLLHSPDNLSIGDFEERVNRRIDIEDELIIDPDFFYLIPDKISNITHVEVQLRKGQYLNETSKYHYDVWLYVNTDVKIIEPELEINWQNKNNFETLQELLAEVPSKAVWVRNVPNLRTFKDYSLLQILKHLSPDSHVSDLNNKLNNISLNAALDPDLFWKLGNGLGYKTFIRWGNNGIDSNFDALFIPNHENELIGCPERRFIGSEKIDLNHTETSDDIHIIDSNPELLITLKNKLKEILPSYMVPAEFVILNKLPLTTTGKIDRKALPIVETNSQKQTFIPPRTPAEILIASIWSEMLNMKEISIDSDFFELGGHSLIAVKVMIAIEKETQKRLPLSSLFESPTIESLAKLIGVQEPKTKWDSLVTIKKTGSKTPIYMVHGGGLHVLVFNPLAKYMDKEQPIYAMQALGLNGKTKLLYTMTELADKYNSEILENDPVGPYAIAGYSFGGLLAYEMAKRLKAMGKEIKMLGILDTYAGGRDSNSTKLDKIFKKITRQFKKLMFFTNAFIQDPKEMLAYQKLIAKRRIVGIFSDKPIRSYEVFSHEEEISKSYDIAYDNYIMEPIDIEVELFRTKKRVYFLDDMVHLGWKAYAKKGVNVHEVPGDHKTFLFPPNDKEFAEILQKALDNK